MDMIIHILLSLDIVASAFVLLLAVKVHKELHVIVEDVLDVYDKVKADEKKAQSAEARVKKEIYEMMAERLQARKNITVVGGEKPLDFPNDHK